MNSRYKLPQHTIQTTIARSGFYILSIGGLMAFFALVLWFSWNNYFSKYEDEKKMSYLESIGLVSIAYVVYSGIRFGQTKECVENTEASGLGKSKVHQQETNSYQHTSPSLLNLNDTQKEELKKELAKCCHKNIKATNDILQTDNQSV